MTICKHCDKPATWRWSDADGNEHSDICERCMETVAPYQYDPLWHFTPLTNETILCDCGEAATHKRCGVDLCEYCYNELRDQREEDGWEQFLSIWGHV